MRHSKKIYDWVVVGAGPAGIAAVGQLLDRGILPTQVLWLDKAFAVGDLGRLWQNVSSNTKVSLFTDFLMGSAAFDFKNAPAFSIEKLPAKTTCRLAHVVEPLQWVTQRLCTQVDHHQATVKKLELKQGIWTVATEDASYHSKKVILATGAEPSALSHAGFHLLPFEQAIDRSLLEKGVDVDKVYGVFGSSHSAMIIVRHLVELNVKKVINFYRSPCVYAVDMGDWILFDNTGLKGETAIWTRQHIDGVWPANLVRYKSVEENLQRYLPDCDTLIYAVGFERRKNILVGDDPAPAYNPHVGIIGPGLFGVGIGYPQVKADPFGYIESQVGLWKFMLYLNQVMPVWFKYHAG